MGGTHNDRELERYRRDLSIKLVDAYKLGVEKTSCEKKTVGGGGASVVAPDVVVPRYLLCLPSPDVGDLVYRRPRRWLSFCLMKPSR